MHEGAGLGHREIGYADGLYDLGLLTGGDEFPYIEPSYADTPPQILPRAMERYGGVEQKHRLSDCDEDGCCRVEVLHNDEWGSVCGKFLFDIDSERDETMMLQLLDFGCSRLGLQPKFDGGPGFPGGSGSPIWLTSINCPHKALNLDDCVLDDTDVGDCTHDDDIGMCCSTQWSNDAADYRLSDCDTDGCCRLEIRHDDAWGTVCSSDISDAASLIACRTFGMVESSPPIEDFSGGSGPIWMGSLHCSGHEKHLLDCTIGDPWEVDEGCDDHSQDLGVCCHHTIEILPAFKLGEPAKDISCGPDHTCALLSSGKVTCWGFETDDPRFRGPSKLPVFEREMSFSEDGPNLNGWNTLAVSGNEPVASDAVRDGYMSSELSWVNEDYPHVNLSYPETEAMGIASGLGFACALFEDSSLKCWGDNRYGQLGLGDMLVRGAPPSDRTGARTGYGNEEMGNNLPAVALGDHAPFMHPRPRMCVHTVSDSADYALDAHKWPGNSLTPQVECKGPCIEMLRYGENGNSAAGLCSDDLEFFTQLPIEDGPKGLCGEGMQQGIVTYGLEWWTYKCCVDNDAPWASVPSCRKKPRDSDFAVCSETFPFVRSFSIAESHSFQSLENELFAQVSFSATVAADVTITFSGLRGSSTAGEQVAIGSDQLKDDGSWDQESGTLLVTTRRAVYSNETIPAFFPLGNAETDNDPQLVAVSCTDGSGDDATNDLCSPMAWGVTASRGVLGVDYVPPVCNETSNEPPFQPFFGESCGLDCYGATIGEKCVCLKSQAGVDCNQTLTAKGPRIAQEMSSKGGSLSADLSGVFEGMTEQVEILTLPEGALPRGMAISARFSSFVEFTVQSKPFNRPPSAHCSSAC